MPSRWTHPTHARGVQSPRLDVRGGKLLTDKMIDAYAREGRYGTEMQEAALARVKKKSTKRITVDSAMKALMRMMGGK